MKKIGTIIILILFLVSCHKKSITIGMITSETGKYSPLLKSSKNGALMAVEEIKAQTGFNIQLIIEDNKSRKENNLDALKRLQDQDIDIVIASITSGGYSLIQDYTHTQDILLVSPTISSSEFDRLDDNLIRFTTSISYFAESLANLFMDEELRDLVIVYDSNNNSYSSSLSSTFSSILIQAGYQHDLHYIPFNSVKDTSFIEIREQFLKLDKDSVFIIASPLDTALLCQQLHGDNLTFFFSPWAISRELIENGGASVDGALFTGRSDLIGNTEEYRDFKKRYKERFGLEPTYQSTANYDMIMAMYDILKDSRMQNIHLLKKEILTRGKIDGLISPYYIDKYGDCRVDLRNITIKDGEFVAY